MALDRRLFLRSTLTLGAAACLPFPMRAAASSQRASVTAFGGDPSGVKDSTAAVRKAIASLSSSDARLVFEAGKYVFAESAEPVMQLNGFQGIEIYANNAELLFMGATSAFDFSNCRTVALHDMKLSWSEESAARGHSAVETNCVSFLGCQGVLVEGVSLQQAPGHGFVASGCRDFQCDDITVTAGKVGRTAKNTGVAFHDCHGDIRVHASHLEGMGGDGIHIQQSYWRIRERIDEQSVVIENNAGQPLRKEQLPQAGDFVQFSAPDTLQLKGEIAISSVAMNSQGATLNFAETLSPMILSGMLVCSVVDGSKMIVDHCAITNTGGSGVVLHRRSEITNNHFVGCGRAAILLAPDVKRMDGPAVQNVSIRTNDFSGCNQGPNADGRGVITIDTAQQREHLETPAIAINSGIKIQGNIFKPSTGAAIYAAGIDGLVVEGNTFGSSQKSAEAATHPQPALILRNVADAEVTGNTSSEPQSIVLMQCADSVATDGNRMLTALKST